jgi:hypothetical protein
VLGYFCFSCEIQTFDSFCWLVYLFVSISLILSHTLFLPRGALFCVVADSLLLYGAVHEKKVGTETDEDVAAMNKKQEEALAAAQLLLEHCPSVRASEIAKIPRRKRSLGTVY